MRGAVKIVNHPSLRASNYLAVRKRGPRDIRTAALVLWFLVAATNPAVGQAGAVETGAAWTLPQLIRHALDNNKGLEATRLATKVVEEDITIAEGQRWPQVSAVSSLFLTPIRERLLFERHGRRPDNPFQQVILNYGVEVRLPLYTGGRISKEINVAEAEFAVAHSRSEVTRQELIFNVTSAYYTYLRVGHDIAAREALVASVEESLRIAREQVAIGRAAELEVLRLEARQAQAESELAVARNNLYRTAATVKALLAVPPSFPLRIAGELAPAQPAYDFESASATALARRPDLMALRQKIAAQRQRVGIANARRLPTLDATANYGLATGEDQTGSDAKFLLNLRIPLYTGDVLPARKRKAVAKLRELEMRLAATERQVLAEVEHAGIDLSSTQARMTAGWRAIARADESLRVEREKFREGRGTGNDLLLAEEALLRSRTRYAAAVADSQIAVASLRLATGELEAPLE